MVTLATGKKIIFQIISDLKWGSLFYQFNFQIEFQLVFFFFFLRLKELLEFKSSPFSIDGRIKNNPLPVPATVHFIATFSAAGLCTCIWNKKSNSYRINIKIKKNMYISIIKSYKIKTLLAQFIQYMLYHSKYFISKIF